MEDRKIKKIFILLGMLLLGIVSYAKADDILGTWLIKENGKIVLEYDIIHNNEVINSINLEFQFIDVPNK